ncbi:MAG: type restriction enzyme subunit [Epulopiscium sp.]|jgi:type I restriction enzyme S subunit|nr:restriction endonuclease subunit [Thermoanaerobacter sp.]MDK2788988.1 type restriction enzyme subunit [Candidatus Epulonipiscium sp.]
MVIAEEGRKLPEGWKWVRLGEVCEVISKGTTPTTLGHNFVPEGIPFLRAEDIDGGAVEINKIKYYIAHETHKVLSRSQLKSGDLLITIAGTLGRVGYVPCDIKELNCNQAVAFARLKKDIIDVCYTCFICKTNEVIGPLIKQKAGGGVQNLNLQQIKQLQIPLPPLSEQKRIAAILKEQMAAVEKAKAAAEIQLEATKALPKAYLQEVFPQDKGRKLPEGWKWVRLGEVCDIKGGKRLPKGAEFAKNVTPYPYIRVVDFKSGTINTNGLKYITEEIRNTISKYIITKDDIYISIAGTIGIVGTVPPELDGANLTENAARISIKDKEVLEKEFICLFLASPEGQAQIKERTNIVGQPKLALERIATIQLPIPPLPEQKRIAAFLKEKMAEAEKLRKSLEEQLEIINKLPTALLRRVFRGEL